MTTEEQIDYGEINNLNSEFDGINRLGDVGKDSDGTLFVYQPFGWRLFDRISYEAKYWKKKYIELLKIKNK